MALYSLAFDIEGVILDLIQADADLSQVINAYYQGMIAELPISHLPSVELIIEAANKEQELTGGFVIRDYSGVITISAIMQSYPDVKDQNRFVVQGNKETKLLAEGIERLLQDVDNKQLGNPTLTNAAIINIEFAGGTVYGPAARGEVGNNMLYSAIIPFTVKVHEAR